MVVGWRASFSWRQRRHVHLATSAQGVASTLVQTAVFAMRMCRQPHNANPGQGIFTASCTHKQIFQQVFRCIVPCVNGHIYIK